MSDKEKEEELLLMQLQDEGDVFETVYGFFQSYLTMGDEEEALSYLSPRFHGIGIREHNHPAPGQRLAPFRA